MLSMMAISIWSTDNVRHTAEPRYSMGQKNEFVISELQKQ